MTVLTANNEFSQFRVIILLKHLKEQINRHLTVFTESRCESGVYRECLLTQLADHPGNDYDFDVIEIRCNENSDYLYIKYNHIIYDVTRPKICEIYFT